jgi:hypothetical protein
MNFVTNQLVKEDSKREKVRGFPEGWTLAKGGGGRRLEGQIFEVGGDCGDGI